MSADAPSAVLAWKVEIYSMTCIVFAATKGKAQMIATRSYWDAYGRRKGEWPRARAWREPRHDNNPIGNQTPQRAWSEDYILGYP